MAQRKSATVYGPTCRFPNCPADVIDHEPEAKAHSLNDITWRIFRIMAEFVEGFEFLSTLKKEVTVFGSARIARSSPWYHEAEKFGRLVAKGGFTMITGGGPGIMEGANKGAFETGGESVGINIQLPKEQRANAYLTRGKGFYYFFTRKVMLSASAQAYIFFPGGFGTLDELMEMLLLMQTKKAQRIPLVLVGKDFWQPLLAWLKDMVVTKYQALSFEDLEMIELVDHAEDAWNIVKHSKERDIF